MSTDIEAQPPVGDGNLSCPVCGEGATPPRCGRCRRPLPNLPLTDIVLSLRDVSKTYGSGDNAVPAVKDLTLEVARGEVVLVAGPSGSGKTTALLLMGLLLRPDSGSIAIRGMDVANTPPSKLPDLRLLSLGFVFQHFNLIASLTAAENVALPLQLAGVVPAIAKARAEELLDELGLQGRHHHRPATLSGGQKQRVAVARALALGPDVILADEPTANLDSTSGHRVMSLLAEIARSRGASTVVVTHDTRFADVTDRVLRLEDGRIEPDVAPNATGEDTNSTDGSTSPGRLR